MPGGVIVGESGLCCYVPVQCVTSIVRAKLLPIVCWMFTMFCFQNGVLTSNLSAFLRLPPRFMHPVLIACQSRRFGSLLLCAYAIRVTSIVRALLTLVVCWFCPHLIAFLTVISSVQLIFNCLAYGYTSSVKLTFNRLSYGYISSVQLAFNCLAYVIYLLSSSHSIALLTVICLLSSSHSVGLLTVIYLLSSSHSIALLTVVYLLSSSHSIALLTVI